MCRTYILNISLFVQLKSTSVDARHFRMTCSWSILSRQWFSHSANKCEFGVDTWVNRSEVGTGRKETSSFVIIMKEARNTSWTDCSGSIIDMKRNRDLKPHGKGGCYQLPHPSGSQTSPQTVTHVLIIILYGEVLLPRTTVTREVQADRPPSSPGSSDNKTQKVVFVFYFNTWGLVL